MRLSHLGDLVHALPVFHALRARHPGAVIGWAVQREFAGLLEGLPGLGRVFAFERRGGARAWTRLVAELGAFAPDLAVDAQGNAKSALVMLASGAPRRVGLDRADWREPFAAHVLTEAAPALHRRTAPPHAMDRMAQLARHLGWHGALRLDPGLTPHERAEGATAYDQRLGAARAPVILALPRPDDPRSWPDERWAELARLLARAGRGVLLLSGPAEAELGARLERALAGEAVAHWVGQHGLRALAAFLAAAAERGARMVACDSGPMHLAAACGVSIVALAGPQDPRRTGPWPSPGPGSTARVVTTPQPPPCMPCLARRCDHAQGPVCMARIGAETVLAALGVPGLDSSPPARRP